MVKYKKDQIAYRIEYVTYCIACVMRNYRRLIKTESLSLVVNFMTKRTSDEMSEMLWELRELKASLKNER
jgi:hypothetical protein